MTIGEVLPFPFSINLNESNLLWLGRLTSLDVLRKTLLAVIKHSHSHRKAESFTCTKRRTFFIVQEVG